MRGAVVFLALACVLLGVAPGLLFGALVGLAPWAATEPAGLGLHLPGTGSLPTAGIALILVALTAGLALLRGRRSAAPAPSWACGQLVEPELRWTSAGFTKPLRLVLESILRPEREITVRSEGGVIQEVDVSRARSPPDRRARLPAGRSALARLRQARAPAAERQPRDVCRLPDRARARLARRRASGPDRMNAGTACAGAAQLVGGILLAPLLPGLVQHWKARLQGRRGRRPASAVPGACDGCGARARSHVEGTGLVYRIAPAVVAASLVAAVLLVPAAGRAPNWGVGHDALALAGLLALARFALAASAWDVGNGFSLMGASRDLTISVFVEATLILSLAVAALVTIDDSDLTGIVAGTAGTARLVEPGARARRRRLRARRRRRDGAPAGRQPGHAPRADDDPRGSAARVRRAATWPTCSGRRQRATGSCSCSRVQVFLPHADERVVAVRHPARRARCPVRLLALTETLVAKMRVLLVPRLLAAGAMAALLGYRLAACEARMSGGLAWVLVALGLLVVGVRRRSIAVALLTVQAARARGRRRLPGVDR